MDLKSLKNKVSIVIGKYKYAVLILLIGIVLMLLPNGSKKKTATQSKQVSNLYQLESIDEELEEILSKVSGAGKVEVLLTVAKGEHTVYQTNENISQSPDSSNSKIDTVILTDADRNEQGVIARIDPVQYEGAIVLCQGADNASVRLAIIDAVSKATGLGTDKICVLKMK